MKQVVLVVFEVHDGHEEETLGAEAERLQKSRIDLERSVIPPVAVLVVPVLPIPRSTLPRHLQAHNRPRNTATSRRTGG